VTARPAFEIADRVDRMTLGGVPLTVLAIPAVVLAVVGVVTPMSAFYGSQGDLRYYQERAAALLAGQVPYRDFGFEYPPLALVPMVVPYLASLPFGASLAAYEWLFLAWEAVLLAALALCLTRIADLLSGAALRSGGGSAAARLAVLTVVAPLMLAFRFDLFPTLLAALAVWWSLADRPVAAGLALGLGVLAKLFPAVLGPALLVSWLLPPRPARLARFGIAVSLTVALGMLPFALLAGDGAFAFLGYEGARGLQLESVASGLVLLAGLLQGRPVELVSNYGSMNINPGAGAAWLAVLPVLTVALLLGLAWLGWSRIRAEVRDEGRPHVRTIVRLAALSLLALLVTSKVFSVQYIVWLLPFGALLSTGQFAVVAVIALLSTGIHPIAYEQLIAQEPWAVLLLDARNALVVGLLVWLAAPLLGPPGPVRREWRARRDSNPRPSGPQPDALSTELRAHALPGTLGGEWRRGRDSNPRSRLPHSTV
jgi:hypothetical protein